MTGMGAIRQVLPNGKRRDLAPAIHPARLFQRADGSVMTDEEIAKVGAVDTGYFTRTPKPVTKAARDGNPSGKRLSDAALDAAWAAVQEHGTQADAARALGMNQGTLQYRLRAYMDRRSLTGELPGIMTPAQQAQSRAHPRIVAAKVTPPAAVKERADYASDIPSHAPAPIADDDSDAPVLLDIEPAVLPETGGGSEAVDDPRFAVVDVRALLALREETPAPRVDDLLEQLSANVVDRDGLLELVRPLDLELSRDQAILVLSAVVRLTVTETRLTVAREAVETLNRHGFDLIIRPRDAA